MRATRKTWHCLQNTSHILVSFIYNIIYLQAVSDPRLYEACYVHTNWSKGSDMESQKKLLLLNTSYLPMAFYWTYESPDERVSSFLYSASREKSEWRQTGFVFLHSFALSKSLITVTQPLGCDNFTWLHPIVFLLCKYGW